MITSTSVDVAIVGAGPYGLSLAAHLRELGVNHRIFGPPMHSWIERMPKGMMLKSAGFASTLYDLRSAFTLERFCRENNIDYADAGVPVALDTFTAYGLEFQRRMVPHLEKELVIRIERSASLFRLTLGNGEVVFARQVVLAIGITHFPYLPPELQGFSSDIVSHSFDHRLLDRFNGREVVVVGAGASAVNVAAFLHEAGAAVQLIARKPAIAFPVEGPEKEGRSLSERVFKPVTGIGVGWKSMFFAHGPLLFRHMPASFRHLVVRRHLGPAPGHFMRERVVGKIKFHLGCSIQKVSVSGERATLSLAGPGRDFKISADHIIAGSGFRVNIDRLTFLSAEMRKQIRVENSYPALSSKFESSVPGLYFVGLAAAGTFGPLLRFAYGAGFATKRLSKHLQKTATQPEWRTDSGTLQSEAL
jgi:thioredoxin reductase